VAKEHGHSVQTMWRVYSAWMEGAVDSDIEAIRSARQLPVTHREPTPQMNDGVHPVSAVTQMVHTSGIRTHETPCEVYWNSSLGGQSNTIQNKSLDHLMFARLRHPRRFTASVSLYSQGILGLGKAAQLAGLSRWEMNRLLAERKVPMHYSPEELAEDLQHGRGGQ
jgi:predicted HTH domain antitoxin